MAEFAYIRWLKKELKKMVVNLPISSLSAVKQAGATHSLGKNGKA
jgi:hypothetical protein